MPIWMKWVGSILLASFFALGALKAAGVAVPMWLVWVPAVVFVVLVGLVIMLIALLYSSTDGL